ncbi:MAG: type 1 glutamine amidotransferase domain-containing protein [Marinilabilia sp.]
MELEGKKIAALIHQVYEDMELWYPVIRLREAEARVILTGEKPGAQYSGKHGIPVMAEAGYEDLKADDFDGVVIPGGYAPDKLRRYPEVLDFVKQMDQAWKPIAIICHAGWVAISADILRGRKVTSVRAIKDDMVNAGGNWVDEPVVIDKNLVSSRTPHDLPVYVKAFIKLLKEGKR